MFETNEEKKLELMRELMVEFIPSTLARLESRLKERGGQFFAGNNLSWADLHAFSFLDRMRLDNTEVRPEIRSKHDIIVLFQLLDDFPAIKSLIERIEELPNISRWLQSRPSTLM